MAIYVLHVFQKKSKSGIKTSKQDIALIEARLRRAQVDYQQWLEETRDDQTNKGRHDL